MNKTLILFPLLLICLIAIGKGKKDIKKMIASYERKVIADREDYALYTTYPVYDSATAKALYERIEFDSTMILKLKNIKRK